MFLYFLRDGICVNSICILPDIYLIYLQYIFDPEFLLQLDYCCNLLLVLFYIVFPLLIITSYLPKVLLWLCYLLLQKISDGSPLCKFFTLAFKAVQFDQFTFPTLFPITFLHLLFYLSQFDHLLLSKYDKFLQVFVPLSFSGI